MSPNQIAWDTPPDGLSRGEIQHPVQDQIEYRCESILPRCSLGRKVNSFKDFDRQTQAWQDQMRDFFFREERKKKIETKYPLLFVVRICYVILLLDMTLRWSVYNLRGENWVVKSLLWKKFLLKCHQKSSSYL